MNVAWRAWLLWAAFIVRNIEEVLFLPAWLARHAPRDLTPPGPRDFAIATAALSLGAAALIALATRALPAPGRYRLAALWALLLLAGALLGNALTHIGISLTTASLMPGVVTGAALQGPAALWLLTGLKPGAIRTALALIGGMALTAPLAAGPLALARLFTA